MVFIEDEDFQRLLDKIASLEAERDRAEGLLRSVESARKLQLTEGQLAELCDIKTKLLYSNEKVRDDQDGCEDEESAPVALLDGELGAEPDDEAGVLGVLAVVEEGAPPPGLGAAVSPESTCSPVDQIVSEVEKLASWWTDGWQKLIVPPPGITAGDEARGPSSHLDRIKTELGDKVKDCERLKREVKTLESRLRVEHKFGDEKVRKARAERDEARNAARDALKRLAGLQVKLQEVQERCVLSQK